MLLNFCFKIFYFKKHKANRSFGDRQRQVPKVTDYGGRGWRTSYGNGRQTWVRNFVKRGGNSANPQANPSAILVSVLIFPKMMIGQWSDGAATASRSPMSKSGPPGQAGAGAAHSVPLPGVGTVHRHHRALTKTSQRPHKHTRT